MKSEVLIDSRPQPQLNESPYHQSHAGVATCLLTRDPLHVRSGRTSVLRTAIEALSKRFERVDCFVLEEQRSNPNHHGKPSNCTLRYVGGPGISRSFLGKCARLISGNALNEILFYDARVLSRIIESVDSQSRLLYCDSLRLAQYAQSLGIPWILDLDDLLSLRFGQFVRNKEIDVTQVLGHFGSLAPGPLKFVMGMVLRPLLYRESIRLGQRENYWASLADEVSLVSRVEANSFRQRIDREIHALPMSIPDVVQDCRWQIKPWKRGSALRGVFVGYLAYQPNVEAIRFLAEKAIPYLRVIGIDLEVSVIGNTNGIQVPDSVRDCPQIRMRGFVEDLDAAFDLHHFFLAPIFTGTGVKTKVLEAMRFGIPVVGTPLALSGLDLADADRLEWQTPETLAATLERLRDVTQLERISLNSRAYVNEHFSDTAVRSRWNIVIDQLVASGSPRSQKRQEPMKKSEPP